MGLISLLFLKVFSSKKEKSFRLKGKTVKRRETDVYMLGCGVSRGNSFSYSYSFSFDFCRKMNVF